MKETMDKLDKERRANYWWRKTGGKTIGAKEKKKKAKINERKGENDRRK